MTADDLAAVLVAVVAVVASGALVAAAIWLVLAARALRVAAERLQTETEAMVDELRAAVLAADDELARADGVLEALEEVTAKVDTASDLAYETISRPVIKVASLGSGTRKAARRLRKRADR